MDSSPPRRHFKSVFPNHSGYPGLSAALEVSAIFRYYDGFRRQFICTLKEDEALYDALQQQMNEFYSSELACTVAPRVSSTFEYHLFWGWVMSRNFRNFHLQDSARPDSSPHFILHSSIFLYYVLVTFVRPPLPISVRLSTFLFSSTIEATWIKFGGIYPLDSGIPQYEFHPVITPLGWSQVPKIPSLQYCLFPTFAFPFSCLPILSSAR